MTQGGSSGSGFQLVFMISFHSSKVNRSRVYLSAVNSTREWMWLVMKVVTRSIRYGQSKREHQLSLTATTYCCTLHSSLAALINTSSTQRPLHASLQKRRRSSCLTIVSNSSTSY